MWPGKWGEKGAKAWEGAFQGGGERRAQPGRQQGGRWGSAEQKTVYRPEPDAWFWVAEYEFFGLTYSKC